MTRLNDVLVGVLNGTLPSSAVVSNNLFDGGSAYNLSVRVGPYDAPPRTNQRTVPDKIRRDRESKGIVVLACGLEPASDGSTVFRSAGAEPYGAGARGLDPAVGYPQWTVVNSRRAP